MSNYPLATSTWDKEELNAIWLEMCKEVRNGKKTWFDWDLRRLFQDVKTSLSSEVVAS